MSASEHDWTQGPRAQRTNPVIFEWVTAYLTHLGFNMMEYALPSAGKTYVSKDKDPDPIAHGYLCPTNENVRALADELKANFQKYEAPCYESRVEGAEESVYIILGAAPALGITNINNQTEAAKDLQYWAYVANMTTQFKQALYLLKKNPEKDVVLHMTGTGIGVYGCLSEMFAQAFLKTASVFQDRLNGEEKKRIHVQTEVWKGESFGMEAQTGGPFQKVCTESLQLKKKSRLE